MKNCTVQSGEAHFPSIGQKVRINGGLRGGRIVGVNVVLVDEEDLQVRMLVAIVEDGTLKIEQYSPHDLGIRHCNFGSKVTIGPAVPAEA